MSIQECYDRIKKRNTNLDVFRAALAKNGLESPRRWQAIIDKLNDKKIPAIQTLDRENILKKIYKDLIKFNDKAIQFAEFDEDKKHLFEKIHQNSFKIENKPCDFFHDISDKDLNELPTRPVLSAITSNDTGLVKTLFFLSREIRRKHEDILIEKSLMSIPALNGYSTFYGIKEETFLRVDLVIIDIKKRTFEFRVDATGANSPDILRDYLEDLKKYFRSVLVEQIAEEWKTVQFSLVNLFPKISTMYNETTSGELSAIGYNTPFGAKNHGVMRGKGDLKKDPSHDASMKASETEIYYITKTYDIEGSSQRIKVTIPGKTSDVGVPSPKLYTAIIEDCYSEDQFMRMIAKLR